MIKILYIGSDEGSFRVVKKVVCELEFLYEESFLLEKYSCINSQVLKEVKNIDCRKIYIVDIERVAEKKYYQFVKYIREWDWNNEILLIRDGSFILEKRWQYLSNIFSIIDRGDGYHVLREKLQLICRHKAYDKVFNFHNRDINLNIYFEKILYVYRDTGQRKIVIVTDNNIYTLNMGLKEAMQMLDERFKQVHRACFVNTMRTEKLDWNQNCFILDTGEKVEFLSKHYKDDFGE